MLIIDTRLFVIGVMITAQTPSNLVRQLVLQNRKECVARRLGPVTYSCFRCTLQPCLIGYRHESREGSSLDESYRATKNL